MLAPFRKLDVWQLSHQLAKKVYKVTSTFPGAERFGLASQIRRAAVSVPTNIVEGNARSSRAEYAHFCQMARASAVEVQYLLELSYELDLISNGDYQFLDEGFSRVAKMLFGLIQKLGGTRWSTTKR